MAATVVTVAVVPQRRPRHFLATVHRVALRGAGCWIVADVFVTRCLYPTCAELWNLARASIEVRNSNKTPVGRLMSKPLTALRKHDAALSAGTVPRPG